MFAGPADHDYSLLAESPCIDAGDPEAQYNDPDGSRNDIGALPYEPVTYVCGDADGSEVVNILDVTYIVNYLYKDGPVPDPESSADADGSGSINILDVSTLVNYLYKNGPEPVC